MTFANLCYAAICEHTFCYSALNWCATQKVLLESHEEAYLIGNSDNIFHTLTENVAYAYLECRDVRTPYSAFHIKYRIAFYCKYRTQQKMAALPFLKA